jgi:protein-tyrosine kinase
MAKTYEALMRAEEEQQKVAKGRAPDPEHRPGGRQAGSRRLPPDLLEEYARMKSNILNLAAGKKMKTLLFAAAHAGEGSTTVLAGFAAALAAEGATVLAVDANLRSPSLHTVFEADRENGLTSLISRSAELAEVIKETPFDNLRVITCGAAPASPRSVFESDGLEACIDRMEAEADWVLFDGAPVTAFNDSISLASRVDGVVLVTRAEKTRWEVAERAKELLESAGGNILGVVLNRRQFHVPKWLYNTL